jgi:hypothetical protein
VMDDASRLMRGFHDPDRNTWFGFYERGFIEIPPEMTIKTTMRRKRGRMSFRLK